MLWIVLGGIFLGAVHDFVSTYVTMREGGKNLTVVARRYIGPAAFVMMLVMLVAILVLVCAAFLDLSATAPDVEGRAVRPEHGAGPDAVSRADRSPIREPAHRSRTL